MVIAEENFIDMVKGNSVLKFFNEVHLTKFQAGPGPRTGVKGKLSPASRLTLYTTERAETKEKKKHKSSHIRRHNKSFSKKSAKIRAQADFSAHRRNRTGNLVISN